VVEQGGFDLGGEGVLVRGVVRRGFDRRGQLAAGGADGDDDRLGRGDPAIRRRSILRAYASDRLDGRVGDRTKGGAS